MYYIISKKSKRQFGSEYSVLAALMGLITLQDGLKESLDVVKQVGVLDNVIQTERFSPDVKLIRFARNLVMVGTHSSREKASRELMFAILKLDREVGKSLKSYMKDMFRPEVYKAIREMLPPGEGAEAYAYLSSLWPTEVKPGYGVWAKYPRRVLVHA